MLGCYHYQPENYQSECDNCSVCTFVSASDKPNSQKYKILLITYHDRVNLLYHANNYYFKCQCQIRVNNIMFLIIMKNVIDLSFENYNSVGT